MSNVVTCTCISMASPQRTTDKYRPSTIPVGIFEKGIYNKLVKQIIGENIQQLVNCYGNCISWTPNTTGHHTLARISRTSPHLSHPNVPSVPKTCQDKPTVLSIQRNNSNNGNLERKFNVTKPVQFNNFPHKKKCPDY
jgi:hypothetical protein